MRSEVLEECGKQGCIDWQDPSVSHSPFEWQTHHWSQEHWSKVWVWGIKVQKHKKKKVNGDKQPHNDGKNHVRKIVQWKEIMIFHVFSFLVNSTPFVPVKLRCCGLPLHLLQHVYLAFLPGKFRERLLVQRLCCLLASTTRQLREVSAGPSPARSNSRPLAAQSVNNTGGDSHANDVS